MLGWMVFIAGVATGIVVSPWLFLIVLVPILATMLDEWGWLG